MDRRQPDDERSDARPSPADDFDGIVAGWRAEGQVPQWPDPRPGEPDSPEWGGPDDDHYVPPEPPPMPRMGRPTAFCLLLLGIGLVLLVAPGLLGVGPAVGMTLGLLSLAGGLGWLVLRIWPRVPRPGDGHGEDDGAVV